MTEKPVELSITVKVYGEVIQCRRKIAIEELETGISQVMQEIGNKVLVAGLEGLDQELRKGVPDGWRNIGTEERSIMSSMGRIRYQRRIYKDEKGRRRALLDTILWDCYNENVIRKLELSYDQPKASKFKRCGSPGANLGCHSQPSTQ